MRLMYPKLLWIILLGGYLNYVQVLSASKFKKDEIKDENVETHRKSELEIVKSSKTIKCPESDKVCLNDQLGYEAIRQLHIKIDDDADGNLNRLESDGYLRDELEYEDGFDRHSQFHGSDDNITVNDLWNLWIQSPVYNWTAEDVVEWLEHAVELPQYAETFRINAVEGRILPRIAVNGKYMLSILGIKNPIDKQKLSVKAQDLVLFGPPKLGHNYMKDLLLVFSVVVAAGGCWLAYMQNKYSQDHLKKVMKDLDTLQVAKESISHLQEKLDMAHKEKEDVAEEKKSLEMKMEDEILNAKQEADQLRRTRECTEEEIGRLKLAEQELEKLKRALERAEYELKHRPHAPIGELQQWLQLTYEVESKHFDAKRDSAEKQLMLAKEMCDKIRRKRGAFLGSLRVAHTTSVDDTDHSISCARSALEEVKLDLQERTQRWHQVEAICGFSIIANPGYDVLDSLLRAPMGSSVSTTNLQNIVSPLNVEDADEDMPPGALTHTAAFYSTSSTSNLLYPIPSIPGRRTPSPRFDRFQEPGLRRNKTDTGFGGGHNREHSAHSARPWDPSAIPGRTRDGSAALSALSAAARDSPAVWPQLMRAGMQLTMLGFDLTDPSLRALHPLPAVSELRERKPFPPHLDNTYSGSRDSLHSNITSVSAQTAPVTSRMTSSMVGGGGSGSVASLPVRSTAFRPVSASTPAYSTNTITNSGGVIPGPNAAAHTGTTFPYQNHPASPPHSASVPSSCSAQPSSSSSGVSSWGAGTSESGVSSGGAGTSESGRQADGESSSAESLPQQQQPPHSNGRVEFGLHELSENATTQPDPNDDPRFRAQSFNQSQSLEQKPVRPRVLPTSLSEGALSGLPGLTGNGSRRPVETPETLDEEGFSLDESQESLNSSAQNANTSGSGTKTSKKRSSKNKLFKMLNIKSKQKTS